MILKGMILSAGLGTRLAPITNEIPKPLVPIVNLPNIVYSIELLRRAGICDIVVNVHHLGDQIRHYLGDGSQWGVRIYFSVEAELLGTAGGIKKAAPFFSGHPFVVVNCDFVCDFDLRPAIQRHFERKAVATMIVVSERNGYTPIFKNEFHQITGIGCGVGTRVTFTGIHILSSKALEFLRPVYSGITEELYRPLVKQGGAFCDQLTGTWLDTGEIAQFFHSTFEILNRLSTANTLVAPFMNYRNCAEPVRGVWIPRGKRLPEKVEFRAPVVIDSPERIASGSCIGPLVVLGEEATVERPCNVSKTVTIGPCAIQEDVKEALIYKNRNLLKQ